MEAPHADLPPRDHVTSAPARRALAPPTGGGRAWLTGAAVRPERAATPEDTRAMERYVAAVTAQLVPWLGLTLAVIFAVWIGIDAVLVSADVPGAAIIAEGRGVIIAINLALFGVGVLTPVARRAPNTTLLVAFVAMAWTDGHYLAALGRGMATPYIHYLFWPTLGSIALLVSVPRRVAAILLLLGVSVAAFAMNAQRPADDVFLAPTLTTLLAWGGISGLIGIMVTSFFRGVTLYRTRELGHAEELERRVQQKTAEIRALERHLEAVREEERQWTAREVHDALGQELTALRLATRFVRRRHEAAGRPDIGLDEVDRLTEQAQRTARGIVRRLRPPRLSEVGFRPSLELLASEMEHGAEITIEVGFTGGDEAPAEKAADVLYRSVQEALTNAVRHAHATRVVVAVARAPGAWVLTVTDDGRGLDPAAAGDSTRLGLVGIRERARAVGGEARWHAGDAGVGFVVRVEIPA